MAEGILGDVPILLNSKVDGIVTRDSSAGEHRPKVIQVILSKMLSKMLPGRKLG
jgi:hypothetical protein